MCEFGDRRAQVRVGIIPERRNTRVAIERRVCDAALNAATTTVHHSNADQSCARRFCDVFLNDRCHVLWSETVEIELRTNGHHYRTVVIDRIAHRYAPGLTSCLRGACTYEMRSRFANRRLR